MRLVSADSSSDFSLPASVTRKRLVVSAMWPITQQRGREHQLQPHRAAGEQDEFGGQQRDEQQPAVMPPPMPADSRGSTAIR